MQGEQVTYQVVLPTLAKRGNLFDEAAVPKAQFLVGYRNILTIKGETVQWGLVKSKQHCGRAFVYPIDESKAAGINQFKGEDEYIETVGTSFILLKVEKDVVKPTAQLGVDAVRGLLEQLGGVDKINLNLIKNAFDSLQEYRSVVDSQTESALGVELGIKELELTEKIQIQCKSKTLSGAALKQLPLISKETGKWDNEKTINLKVLEY